MNPPNRRQFLTHTPAMALGCAAGFTILTNPRSARAAPAADKVILAAVGVGGRGTDLATHPQRGFLSRADCEYAYVCDPDYRKAGSRVASFARLQQGREPQVVHRLPRGAGRPVGGRDRQRHPRPLARPLDRLGLPGRQGRLRRKAGPPQLLGRSEDGRGGPEVPAGGPGRHPEPQCTLQHGRS